MTSNPGRTLLRAQRIVDADGKTGEGWILVDGAAIVARGEGLPPSDLAASERAEDADTVIPGLVDIHVHGAFGVDFADVGVDPQPAIDYHYSTGSTTILASLATGTEKATLQRIRELRPFVASGALCGLHLEGPWLARARRGAHVADLLRVPTRREMYRLLDAAEGGIRMVTIAPELPGAMDAIPLLAAEGVIVAIGHTDANADRTEQAIDSGASVITHLYNGMPPLHHRNPGVAGAALARVDVAVELIADGAHVDDRMVDVTFRAAAGRVIMVSDAMSAAGQGDGKYRIAGSPVIVDCGIARLADGTSLAGGARTLGEIVRRQSARGMTWDSLVQAAATLPARILGLTPPLLRPADRANLIAIKDGVVATMKDGRWLAS